jgi:hypothetical protein
MAESKTDTRELDELVRRIHDAPVQLVLAITGGGSRAIAELLERPGGSRVLVEAIVPYSAAALIEFLQAAPEQFCSPRTARLMAMAAYQRALQLCDTRNAHRPPLPPGEGWGEGESDGPSRTPNPLSKGEGAANKGSNQLIGLACTASLASDRPKRGDHRIHVAYQTRDATAEYSIRLTKGRRTRFAEESIASRLILNATSDGCGEPGRLDLSLESDELVDMRHAAADEAQQELLHGGRRALTIGRTPIVTMGVRRAIFPGAFNPLHDGHREMARIAAKRLRLPVEFELSIHNVDKPPLDYLEMRDRAQQFGDHETLWLTRAPTFEEKSRIFADATFIVGADTIARIASPAYYGDSERAMLSAIDRIAARGGRFLVFGRSEKKAAEGQQRRVGLVFQTLLSLDLPPNLLALCDEVSESDFRADVSSTELRAAGTSVAPGSDHVDS